MEDRVSVEAPLSEELGCVETEPEGLCPPTGLAVTRVDTEADAEAERHIVAVDETVAEAVFVIVGLAEPVLGHDFVTDTEGVVDQETFGVPLALGDELPVVVGVKVADTEGEALSVGVFVAVLQALLVPASVAVFAPVREGTAVSDGVGVVLQELTLVRLALGEGDREGEPEVVRELPGDPVTLGEVEGDCDRLPLGQEEAVAESDTVGVFVKVMRSDAVVCAQAEEVAVGEDAAVLERVGEFVNVTDTVELTDQDALAAELGVICRVTQFAV